MKQQLSKQRRKSRKLCKIAKNDCWSDEIEYSGNDDQVWFNNTQIPQQLHCHSSIQCVRGKYPNFDKVSLLTQENGLEEIILYRVIDESNTRNVELTCLDPFETDSILYTIGNSGTCTCSIDYVFPILMVYVDDSDKVMLHHPSFFEIKSWLSSRSYEYHKKSFHCNPQVGVLYGIQVKCDSLIGRW